MKSFLWGFLGPLSLIFIGEVFLRLGSENKVSYAKKIGGVPAVGAQLLLTSGKKFDLVPLGGIANHKTVLCKEGENWALYQGDRYGFPNPDHLWEESENEIDFAFVGDSYFQGACLNGEETLVNKFRLKNKVLNLSSFGHGPLAQLGLVLEYLKDIKPRHLVLSYVPNDLSIDLPLEISHPVLRGYLKGNLQNLKYRQSEIDEQYKKKLLREIVVKKKEKILIQKWFYQKSLALSKAAPISAGYETDYMKMKSEHFYYYQVILKKIFKVISSYGGQVSIVFIPDRYFLNLENEAKKSFYKLKLKETIEGAGVQFIDLSMMFKKEENPSLYYVPISNYYGHFNSLGTEKAYQYLREMLH